LSIEESTPRRINLLVKLMLLLKLQWLPMLLLFQVYIYFWYC